MSEALPSTTWVDVEDLFEYARFNGRPSGIQRVAIEIYQGLHQLDAGAGRIRFVRHDPMRARFRGASWASLEGLFDGLTAVKAKGDQATATPAAFDYTDIPPEPRVRNKLRALVYRLPLSVRVPMLQAARHQMQAVQAAASLLAALPRGAVKGVRRLGVRRAGQAALQANGAVASHGDTASAGGSVSSASDGQLADMQPGDTLLVLGSPWFKPDYAELVEAQRRNGVRFGLMVYDIIPLRRPEWCDRGLVRIFRSWFRSVLPICDRIFAISHATAEDLQKYAAEEGLILPEPIHVIPMGSGFGAPRAVVAPTHRKLPPDGSYALIVSTIEARKNHALLFRVWRKMLEDMPVDQVPSLVFAGRVGWMVHDFMHQVANTDFLDGKLIVIQEPSDADLVALYGGCLFTLFPSLYEGWGLPVTESLMFGKPCVISDRASLPEAGGAFARYFDPENVADAYSVIRDVVEDRDGLIAWEAQIRRDFRPILWTKSAEAILEGLAVAQAPALRP
jgi:glycosyltransferase involved in cell wall biosynthesis